MTRERKCPHCGGIVTPPKRGVDPDVALDKHIEMSHDVKKKEPSK